MDFFILLTQDPVVQALIGIAGLAFGIVVASRVLQSSKVPTPSSPSGSSRAPLNKWDGSPSPGHPPLGMLMLPRNWRSTSPTFAQ